LNGEGRPWKSQGLKRMSKQKKKPQLIYLQGRGAAERKEKEEENDNTQPEKNEGPKEMVKMSSLSFIRAGIRGISVHEGGGKRRKN